MHKKASIKERLETSLQELGSHQVDILYLHTPDRSVAFEETLEACNELFEAGKFKRLGLSNYAACEVSEIWNVTNERGWIKPTVHQAMYNAFTRSIEDDLVPCCQKYGVNIIAYNPLAGGMLSGKYKRNDTPSDGRFSSTDSNVGKMYRKRYMRDANFEALRILDSVAKKHNLTMPEIAFRWLVHHSNLDMTRGNDGVAIGVSSLKQLENNLDDLEKPPLPAEVVEVLDDVWQNITKAACPLYWR